MDVHEFSKALWCHLGESGGEAVLDAINFALLHCKDFACEEDKLLLLNILNDNREYAIDYFKEHNALLNFRITFVSKSE